MERPGPIRTLGLCLAMAAGVASAIAPTAAASSVKMKCTIPLGSMKLEDKDDPRLGVRLVGGRAWADISLLLVCEGVEKGVPATEVLTVHASGYYHGVVCGTAKSVARIDDVDGPPKYASILGGDWFAMEFIATIGTFYWEDWDKPALPNTKIVPPDPKDPSPRRWQPGGVVLMSQPLLTNKPVGAPDVLLGECTKAFQLAGEILIDQ